MEWVCYGCGRHYDRDPGYCQCGSVQFKMFDSAKKPISMKKIISKKKLKK